MVTFDLDLARRFDVPLVRGMAVRTPHGSAGHFVGLGDDGRLVLWAENDETSETDADLVLDYTDPGTLGHILAAVRAAWGDDHLIVNAHHSGPGSRGVWWVEQSVERPPVPVMTGTFPTEAHALAAAWEGRPR